MASIASESRSPAMLETHLLDLFAPASVGVQIADDVGNGERTSIWREEAIHRAKNLAQLSIALANVISQPSERWSGSDAATPARVLARTYEELGRDSHSTLPVPCLAMLAEVVGRLTQIFGHARHIVIVVAGSEVFLPPERRRALILIGSELVINALKYAFPALGPGTISVTLKNTPTGIDMIIQDDGVGTDDAYSPGQGTSLLDRLAVISGITITRAAQSIGGLCVTVHLPATDQHCSR